MSEQDWLCLSAGPADELRTIAASLQKQGVFARELDTLGLAYHSPALDPLLPELQQGKAFILLKLQHMQEETSQAQL